MNSVKEIDVKNCTYYFVNDMINIKSLDSTKLKLDEKSYKNILIYYIAYVTVRELSYVTTIIVKLLYLIINKINVYIEKNNGNKYLTLVSSGESMKNYRATS